MADDTKKLAGDQTLDSRQAKITEGAGLDESRVNQDFVDFLQKWSTPILLVIVAAVAVYVGLQKWREHKDNKLALAFAELDNATRLMGQGQDALPTVLVRIAEDHAGQGSVSLMARLAAAEQYQVSAMKGVEPGAEFDFATMKPKKAEDVLSPERRREFLDNAVTQYTQVLDAAKGNNGLAVQCLSAHFGLASVAETRRQWDEAQRHYEAAHTLALARGFKGVATLATQRLESLASLKDAVPMLPEASIMSVEKAAVVVPPPAPTSLTLDPSASMLTNPGTTGSSSLLNPMTPPPAPAPSPAPSPEKPKQP